MNKQIIIFLTICSLFIFSCSSEESNNSNNLTDSSKSETNTNQEDLKSFSIPDELTYENRENFISEKFYPIGWSETGKFAYIIEPADEGSGYYYFNFIIMDIISGKIIWNWEINSDNKQETGSITETWQKNASEFVKKMKENNIIQTNNLKIETFPSNINGSQCELQTDITHGKDQAGFGFEVVLKSISYLKINKTTKVKIEEKNYEQDIILNVTNPGFIKSPDNKFIAIINKTERWGYEGPPNVISINISGYKVQ